MVDAQLSSKVELYLSAKHLPKMDTLKKGDFMGVVYLKDAKSGHFSPLGQTEIIKAEDAAWTKRFVLDYKFEENQELLFEIYDIDSGHIDLKDMSRHDFVGYADFTLGDLVAAPGCHTSARLKKKTGGERHKAVLIIRVEELKESNEFCKVDMQGVKLEKMDFLGKSDPFIRISRQRVEDKEWVQVHETEVIKNTLNPNWKTFTVTLQTLCNSDYNRPLLFQCFDWNSNGKADYMGEFQTTFAQLMGIKDKKEVAEGKSLIEGKSSKFTLTRPNHKKPSERTTPRGEIVISKFQLLRHATFLDYIKGGMQIGLMVAVDFTASNGDPASPDSLHYRYGKGPNQYQSAIQSIGNILAPYDTDNRYPVYGFGGRLGSEVSHCFPLTFNSMQPEVQGVAGILDIYHRCFERVILSGPTYFSELLQTAASIASTPYRSDLQHYTILLILTDGVINDMPKTIESLVAASDKPLSIVIVGIGGADFKQMEKLDADDTPLSAHGIKRDIVQFVPMRKFTDGKTSGADLAKETLAEIPRQVIQFMKMHNVAPMPPRKIQPMPSEKFLGPMTGGPTPMMGPPVMMGGPPPVMLGGPPPTVLLTGPPILTGSPPPIILSGQPTTMGGPGYPQPLSPSSPYPHSPTSPSSPYPTGPYPTGPIPQYPTGGPSSPYPTGPYPTGPSVMVSGPSPYPTGGPTYPGPGPSSGYPPQSGSDLGPGYGPGLDPRSSSPQPFQRPLTPTSLSPQPYPTQPYPTQPYPTTSLTGSRPTTPTPQQQYQRPTTPTPQSSGYPQQPTARQLTYGPPTSTPTPTHSDTWACTVCTLLNPNSASNCSACGTHR